MSDFMVFSRKYRPKTFASIKGQEHITSTIQNAIKHNQVANAFLFCGLLGSGKTSLARVLARALNCDQLLPSIEPCGTCQSCTQQASFAIHELDGASHNLSEDMKNIRQKIRFRLPNQKKTIIIIDECHMLSTAALNVLLKPLEDTPLHVVFILITTEKHKIIPTILSRCQVFNFHAISLPKIKQQLKDIAQKEAISCEEEGLDLIAEKANGSLRNAISTFNLVVTFGGEKKLTYKNTLHHLNLLDDTVYFNIMSSIYEGDTAKILLEYDSILRTGFDGLFFVTGFAQHLRNLLLAKASSIDTLMRISQRVKSMYEAKAKELPMSFIYQVLDILQACETHYRNSFDHRLHVELSLIKMSHLGQSKSQATKDRMPATKHIPEQKEEENEPKQQERLSIPTNGTEAYKANDSLSGAVKQQNLLEKTYTYDHDRANEQNLIAKEPTQSLYTPKEKRPTETALEERPTRVEEKLKKPRTIAIPSLEEIHDRVKKKRNFVSSDAVSTRKTPLKQQTIETWMISFAERCKKNNELASNSLLKRARFILMPNKLVVILNSTGVDLSCLERTKNNVKNYLQERLSDPKFPIVFETVTKTKQPYTDQEKLEDLASKNKKIDYIKNKLGLNT